MRWDMAQERSHVRRILSAREKLPRKQESWRLSFFQNTKSLSECGFVLLLADDEVTSDYSSPPAICIYLNASVEKHVLAMCGLPLWLYTLAR